MTAPGDGATPVMRARVSRREPDAHLVESNWEQLARLGMAVTREVRAAEDTDASVDVIVPVHSGYDETLACLYSVLTSKCRTAFRLIVIDDASPNIALAAKLASLSALGLFALERNAENLGFVATANRGLSLSRKRDAILLNADAVVYNDWLDRLRAHGRGEGVASVTPLSNNATIASYPREDASGRNEIEVDPATLDAAAAEVNRRGAVEAPTGVGFCFYMPRTALDLVGLLDVATFGRGYGEENDWCRRAANIGLTNLIAIDIFASHIGGVSFSESAGLAQARASEKLNFLHPTYYTQVGEFHRLDPVRPGRASLDAWRVRRLSAGKGVLLITHHWGGGVARLVEAEIAQFKRRGVFCLIAQPEEAGRRLVITAADGTLLPNLPLLDLDQPGAAKQALTDLGLGSVEVHSLVGLAPALHPVLAEVMAGAGLKWASIVHDYIAICPRINMVDVSGGYCSSPSVSYCQACVDTEGSPFGVVDIAAWRADQLSILRGSEEVRAPHADVAARLLRYLPDLGNVIVYLHPYLTAKLPRARGKARLAAYGSRRQIALIGGLGPHKGARVLLALAADAILRDLPLDFTVYGFTDLDERLSQLGNVRITGRYDEERLDEMLEGGAETIALLPSVCPETFSFTLDHAFRNGLYPVVFDIGAPAARIRAAGYGDVMPFDWMFDPPSVNDHLLALKPIPLPLGGVVEAGRAYPERV